MSNQSASDRAGGFKSKAAKDKRYTHSALTEHNGPQKPGRAIAPQDADVSFASARRDLAFTHDGSLRAVPRDVFGRRFTTNSTTTMREDSNNVRCKPDRFPIYRDQIRIHPECPGVSYGVLPRGRTPMATISESTDMLWRVSWVSSPQPGYKRVSVCGRMYTHPIVASNPRTPRTGVCCLRNSGASAPLSAESVSSPGAGHDRTPQDNSRPGRPDPNPETTVGWCP
jgi:hypothetical protein